MAITAEQRVARRSSIGSSDSAAILGVDPYDNIHDVYLEKVYGTEDRRTGATDMGNLVEPLLVQWAGEQLDVDVVRDVFAIHREHGILTANLDGLAHRDGKRIGIEAKFTGLADEFGEPGTDQVPDRVIVQALHQIEVATLEAVYVPVLLARRGRPTFELFRVDPNPAGQDAIVERDLAFWRDHVEKRVPPSGAVASLEVLKRIQRVPNKTVEVPDMLVTIWEATKLARKEAELEEEEAKARLLAAMGDAEAATYGEFGRWLTYYSTQRKGYVVEPSTFRTLRVSKKP